MKFAMQWIARWSGCAGWGEFAFGEDRFDH